MLAHNLSFHTPSTPKWGQKVKHFFLNVVMLHIKYLGQVDIEIIQICMFIIELSTEK